MSTAEPRWIGPLEIDSRFSIAEAIAALEAAFRGELPRAPHRVLQEHGDGALVCMPAAGGTSGAGVKIITVHPDNALRGLPYVQGVFVVFDDEALTPRAIIDGGALARLRAPAVTALATSYLARQDARVLVVFGAGVQAVAHVEAMRAVRPIEEVRLVGRDPANAAGVVDYLRGEGIDARIGDPGDVVGADIVCTCTSAGEPLFNGGLLDAGAHVNAIGAYEPSRRELDTVTIQRGRVVVEDREAVLGEAGDLLIPIADGDFDAGDIAAELVDLVRGRQVRERAEDVTVFKSVGAAYEDLIVATALLGAVGDRASG